jgi:hypothetical protein
MPSSIFLPSATVRQGIIDVAVAAAAAADGTGCTAVRRSSAAGQLQPLARIHITAL